MANRTLDDYCYALRTELHLIRDMNATFITSLSNHTKEFLKSTKGTVIRIEFLVVLITVIQLFLAIFGSWRRRSRKFFIQKGVLVAYTLSSSLVSYTLGSMQSAAVKSSMYKVWGISLFTLLGCADSITAYSLTNNSQITGLFFQSALGFSYSFLLFLTALDYTLNEASLMFRHLPLIILASIQSVSFAKTILAFRLASASWPLNKSVADYMCQEHTMGESPYLYDPNSMGGYHYLVDWPMDTIKLGAGTSYVLEFPRTRLDQIIDIEKVWQDNGERLLSPDLKDACLSFSLFHLLRRRFFGFECGESSQQKTHDFVFTGLLAKKKNAADGAAGKAEAATVDYDWVFKVIEVELDFMYDFFFTMYAATYYGRLFIQQYFVPLSSASFMVVIAFLTAGGLLGPSSASYRMDHDSVLLDNATSADICITVAILVCTSVLQVVQVLYYWMTIWGRVSFACQRVKGSAGCCMRLKELLVHIGVLTSTSCSYHSEQKVGQYSLLKSVSSISNQSMFTKCLAICENEFLTAFASSDGYMREPILNDVWRVVRKHGEPTELLPTVKKALVQSLERTQGKLTNGVSSLSSNRADDLLWACKLRLGSTGTRWSSQKEENQVCVILAWHIATCYCDKELAGAAMTEDLKEHHEVATTLSKYTAYLVGFQPELLPGHHHDTRIVFKVVATEAIRQSEGINQDEETIYRKGLRLGEQLNNMEAARCWKVLADFWAEMLLYLAPSDNVKEHVECLAKGGELITLLWALLTHAGILDRGERNYVTNDTENPGDRPSYTYSCTSSTTCAAPSSSETNQSPTTSNRTRQRTERDVGETRDSGTNQSDSREVSNGAALRLRHATSYLDKCAEGATSAATHAMNNPALLGNCSETVGMTLHQPASPEQNGQGARNDASNGLNEIEEIA